MIAALIIFVLMYIGMLAFSKYRVWFALGGAVAMVVTGVLSVTKVPSAINWNVIMMIAGTMGLVTLFIETGMPARLADLMLKKMPNACAAIIALCVFSGVVSAFVDNVATVLMVAPVGLAICKKLKINPVPVIISIAVSSNLQGAATLVGDTTSILLGGYAGMSFIDFLFWQGKFSIFWAVEFGALGTVVILYFIFRKQKQPVTAERLTPVTDHVPGIMLAMVVVCLIIASFFEIPVIDDIKNGLICMTIFIIELVRNMLSRKSTAPLKLVLKELDYQTLLMLCGLFTVIAGITEAGIIDKIADWFSGLGGGNLFV
ncbi:MAG: arsenic transporter, partial [Lachnospiraceae bacterium]|nr:arsenic transporter [Lachnospiraceae bacterium]